MVKIICVSGSVATGKTTLAKKLAKLLNFEYLDVKEVINQNPNVVARYDRKRKTKEVDVVKLNKILTAIIKHFKEKGIVIDSHLSHYLPRNLVDLCIITECANLKKLKLRLKKRKYNGLKIKENLEAEILETCLVEALEEKHNVLIVDTSKKIDYKTLKKRAINLIK